MRASRGARGGASEPQTVTRHGTTRSGSAMCRVQASGHCPSDDQEGFSSGARATRRTAVYLSTVACSASHVRREANRQTFDSPSGCDSHAASVGEWGGLRVRRSDFCRTAVSKPVVSRIAHRRPSRPPVTACRRRCPVY